MKIAELLNELARSGDGDEDIGDWKKVSFKGENVYYNISLCSFLERGYGLQVQVALRAHAFNAESEFIHDKSIEAYSKNKETTDRDALALVFKWLNEHGTKQLHALSRDWAKYREDYHMERTSKLSKALKGKKTLPKGHKIIKHPQTGHPFVYLPNGDFVPNQEVNDYKTTQDIIDNFYAWQALNKD